VEKKKKYCHNPEWKRRRRSTATIRVEKNKDKHLHDMIQNYSSGEISHEQYIWLLGLNTKQEWDYETINLSSCIYLL
jgi:hypothetical protein